jgi:tRNA (guanine37-N1)-methyltransferase
MEIDVLTIFPAMFGPVLNESMIKIAQKKNLVRIKIHNLRDWSKDKHKKVDDRPFGGGPGMVMGIGPIYSALRDLKNETSQVMLLSPQGKKLNQALARELIRYKHLIMICGHYEGVDERVKEHLIDREISIGDYVLTCGELPAMVLIDCVVRLIPGVLGDCDSLSCESFSQNMLEYPQYTRPADFKDWKVPDVLLSGDHKKIEAWREKQSLKRTRQARPDLLEIG